MNEKIVFKKKKAKNLRKAEDEDEEENNLGIDIKKLNELKEIREIKRKKNNGLNAEKLLDINEKKSIQNTNGLTTAESLANDLDLGKTFSVETNRRDEDADMFKFIEEELAKRKGKINSKANNKKFKLTQNLDDIVFSQLPEHLLKTNKAKNEEMLSNQMLNGIPEIDLGFNEKIRNIEATDEAKKILNIENKNKNSKDAIYVPNNMAVNYVQHNKFSISDNTHQNKKVKRESVKLIKEPVVVIGNEPRESLFKVKQSKSEFTLKFPGREKASDDYHYEKFKRAFRK